MPETPIKPTLETYKVENSIVPEKLDVVLNGPRADADWSKATITVKVPVHGTAQTTVQEVEMDLLTFAGVVLAAQGDAAVSRIA